MSILNYVAYGDILSIVARRALPLQGRFEIPIHSLDHPFG